MPENSDWISCSGCENSRNSGEKPNFDPKPQKPRNDSSYQSVHFLLFRVYTMRMKNIYQIVIALSCLVVASCASPPPPPVVAAPPAPIVSVIPVEPDTEQKDRENIVAKATELLGQKPNAKVVINNRSFTLDCIGTISAVYWSAGYDIQKDFSKYEGNGVNRLYQSLVFWAAIHELKLPKPGDIIFWANTYDRNENGILTDDGLTHVGLVMKVDEDGTVSYMHESMTRGTVIAYFNLLHPDIPRSPEGKIWNSPMYLGSNYDKKNNPPHWLSGDLWSSFGDAGKTMKKTRL